MREQWELITIPVGRDIVCVNPIGATVILFDIYTIILSSTILVSFTVVRYLPHYFTGNISASRVHENQYCEVCVAQSSTEVRVVIIIGISIHIMIDSSSNSSSSNYTLMLLILTFYYIPECQ